MAFTTHSKEPRFIATFSGTGAIDETLSFVGFVGRPIEEISIRISDGAGSDVIPTTNEDFRIRLDSVHGQDFDFLLFDHDPAAEGWANYINAYEGHILLEDGDALKFSYANTDGNTIAIRVVAR